MSPAPDTPRPVCPECERPFNPGRETCMWCGASLEGVEVPLQVLDCPVCDGTLRPQEGEGWTVHICDKCTGIWMNAFMMQRLEKMYEDATPEGVAGSPVEAASHIEDGGEAADMNFRYRRCPECCDVMRRDCYKFSGVILDACMGHGTWFDASEFEKILSYLKAGGLQKYEDYESKQRSVGRKPGFMTSKSYTHHHSGGLGFLGGFYSF